jgi:hypothetical protein
MSQKNVRLIRKLNRSTSESVLDRREVERNRTIRRQQARFLKNVNRSTN